jgi:hypothetical protein
MKNTSVFMVIMAVVVLMAALSGCTSTNPPVAPVQSTPVVMDTPAPTAAVTVMPTSVPVPAPDNSAVADKKFADATETCFTTTPVISDVTTHLAFVTCMQNTPEPKGLCALNYRNNVLKYTKDDATTAGYARETTRIKLARDAFSRNMSYNSQTDKAEPCSQLPMSAPI